MFFVLTKDYYLGGSPLWNSSARLSHDEKADRRRGIALILGYAWASVRRLGVRSLPS